MLCVQVTCCYHTAASNCEQARGGSLGGKERQTIDDIVRTYHLCRAGTAEAHAYAHVNLNGVELEGAAYIGLMSGWG